MARIGSEIFGYFVRFSLCGHSLNEMMNIYDEHLTYTVSVCAD